MSNKTEHLNMIQGVITRMANNSLQIKCWSMAIMAALIALSDYICTIAGVIPLMLFWYLDSMYLALERGYRELFDEVRVKNEEEIDFSMKPSSKGARSVMFTWSEALFYLVMMVLVFILGVIKWVV